MLPGPQPPSSGHDDVQDARNSEASAPHKVARRSTRLKIPSSRHHRPRYTACTKSGPGPNPNFRNRKLDPALGATASSEPLLAELLREGAVEEAAEGMVEEVADAAVDVVVELGIESAGVKGRNVDGFEDDGFDDDDDGCAEVDVELALCGGARARKVWDGAVEVEVEELESATEPLEAKVEVD